MAVRKPRTYRLDTLSRMANEVGKELEWVGAMVRLNDDDTWVRRGTMYNRLNAMRKAAR